MVPRPTRWPSPSSSPWILLRPCGVVPGHPADELADFVDDGWSAARGGGRSGDVGPAGGARPAGSPGSRSAWAQAAWAGGGPARTGSPGLARTVVAGCEPGGAAPRPRDAAPVAQRLRAVTAGHDEQGVKHADRDQIGQLEYHEHQGAPAVLGTSSRRVRHVLAPYRNRSSSATTATTRELIDCQQCGGSYGVRYGLAVIRLVA
jgi:hypothetical protein